jgi:sugar lactone lactonase YvrE
MNYRQEGVLSGRGTAPHQFLHRLTGIGVGEGDNLYAVGDSSVKIFTSDGKFVRSWTTSLPGFSVGIHGREVYVGEEGQIEIFDPDGRLQRIWRDSKLLGRVTAIGRSGDDFLAADAAARCIRRFDRDGNFLNNIGDSNRMRGFNIPNGALDFSIDGRGTIHACNPGKHRVERYTPVGELLGHVGRFDGRDPEGFPGCCNPTNVTVTAGGLLFVTEKAGPRAKVLDAEGQLITVIATAVFDPNCKNMDLAVNSEGVVYVVDTVRLEIHVFVPV